MSILPYLTRGRLASVIGVGLALAGAILILVFNQPHYPMAHWMLWHYLALFSLGALWTLSCLSIGDRLLRTVLGFNLPTYERVAIGLAVGVFTFETLMFLLGLVKLWGTGLFVGLPLALLASNATAVRGIARRARRLWGTGQRLPPAAIVAILFGLGILALIYFCILTPYNVQFDARWKHMALAEDYVASAGVRRMDEGWVFSMRPHFTSFAYAWAFLLPFGTLFHRMVLGSHMEYFVFVATTFFGISAIVRRLVPKADPRLVWVARFIFPGVLVYDSTLSGGADHFGALFGPAVVLTLMRAWPKLDRRWVALLVTCVAAGFLVKETVAIMLAPVPVMVLMVRGVMLAIRARTHSDGPSAKHVFGTASLALGVGMCLTAPCWLSNWVWHGNPVYPHFGDFFPSHPWSSWSSYKFEHEYSDLQMWQPPRTLAGFLRSLLATVDFSFLPNDWKKFHGDRPVFGSLFTLFVPWLFFLRGTRRIWVVVAGVHVAVFTWYWVHHQDRYLQAILPIMAAVTAAILVLIWRQMRRIGRFSAGALITVQLAVAADCYFLPTHAMTGSAVKRMVELLGLGHTGKYEERFTIEPKMTAIGNRLAPNAKILFHEQQSHLGTAHASVQDAAFWQYGIDYGRAGDPIGVHRIMTDLGVTHIAHSTTKSLGMDTLAGDFMFFDYVYRRAKRPQVVEGMRVVEVPDGADNSGFADRAVVVNCGTSYQASLHHVVDLALPAYGPKSRPSFPSLEQTNERSQASRWFELADFVAADPKCDVESSLSHSFTKVAERPKRGKVPAYNLWVRSR
jgi:hypothetical protein